MDRANFVAGEHGQKGRTNAAARQERAKAGPEASTSAAATEQETERAEKSNKGGALKGLDRANLVAGEHGQKGRTNAAEKQERKTTETESAETETTVTTSETERPERSNKGGALRGLDRANLVAGEHGQKGRTNAAEKQGRAEPETETETVSTATEAETLERSNKGGALRGLDRANLVAGEHGLKGRTNAAEKQGRTATEPVDDAETVATGVETEESTKSNKGGTVRGLDRANFVAGEHGQKGRANAATKRGPRQNGS